MSAIKVQELNKYIKKYISMDYLLSDIEVEGEISNFKYHSNGNMYLSLKDDHSKINAIVYSMDTNKIDFEPQNGDKVLVRGSVSIYEKDASVSFFIREMKLKGLGDLHEKYLRLKDSLYKEGLFDENIKKKISFYPKSVGVITSPTGAAIRDIINVLNRRNNTVDIVIYPSLVQGEYAAKNVIKGIKYFNENPVDTIILGRGGGGYEDLFAFNDEELAREIFKSKIPIISAVGHEIDYVISDFVSDIRAATPSAAAEIVSMSKEDLLNKLDIMSNRSEQVLVKKLDCEFDKLNDLKEDLDFYLRERLDRKFNEINLLKRFLDMKKPVVKNSSLENLFKDLNKAFNRKLQLEKFLLDYTFKNIKSANLNKNLYEKKENLNLTRKRLDRNIFSILNENKLKLSLVNTTLKNPLNTNILIKDNENKLILNAESIKSGDNIKILFNDGEVDTLVNKVSLRSELDE